MTHKFNVNNKHKLDNVNRRKLLPPDKTLMSLGLQEGDIIADIGCGIGYFSIPASEIVKGSGIVYAMDILKEMLQDVETKIKENKITNIKTVLTEETDLKLKDGEVTFAFICNVLHETEELEKFLEEIKKILRIEGKIAIVDWEKIKSDYGPPIEHRLDKEDLKKVLDKLKFSNITEVHIDENYYGITAKKN